MCLMVWVLEKGSNNFKFEYEYNLSGESSYVFNVLDIKKRLNNIKFIQVGLSGLFV